MSWSGKMDVMYFAQGVELEDDSVEKGLRGKGRLWEVADVNNWDRDCALPTVYVREGIMGESRWPAMISNGVDARQLE